MDPNRHRIPLPLDLVKPIADRLLADDIVDYISFRAVCRDWRSLTASARSFASQFQPRQWIMLPNFEKNPSGPSRFLNLFTGRSLILNHLPELESHSVISVCDGIIVLLDKETVIMRIFNPFTRHMSDDLPPLELESGFPIYLPRNHEIIPIYKFLSIMISDDSPCPTLMIYIPFGSIIFAKPGDRKWKYKQCELMCLMTNTLFSDKIYYISHTNQIWVTKLEQRNVTSLIPLQCDVSISPSDILVKFGSELLLVHQIGELIPENFEIFRVDLELNNLVKLDNIGEYALFIGVNRQIITVPSKSFPSIKSNSIYCFLLDRNTMYLPKYIPSAQTAIYSLDDQRFELLSNFHNGDLIHPCTLADWLFKYCSML